MPYRGNEELVPGGISGDFLAAAAERHPRLSSPDLGRVAYLSEIADRFNHGAVTPEEEAELIEHLQRAALHESL